MRRRKRKDKNPIYWIGFSLLIILLYTVKTYYLDATKEGTAKFPPSSSVQLQKKGADVYLSYDKAVKKIDSAVRDAFSYFAVDAMKAVFDEKTEKKMINGTQDAEFITWTSSTRKYDLTRYAQTGYTLNDYGKKIRENVKSVGARIDTFDFSSDTTEHYLTIKILLDINLDGKKHNLHTHTLVLSMSDNIADIPTSKPKLAIIIDDLGDSASATKLIWDLKRPVTVAILPFLSSSQKDAQEATKYGLEVLLHLPMEAINQKSRSGPGTVTERMTEKEVDEQVVKALESVPYAIGVNNHMGSKGTANKQLVERISKTLKKKNVFFVDSRTTADSKVVDVSREMGLPHAQNQHFIDNSLDPEAIRSEIRKLIKICLRDGKAIGIGHVRENTLKVLKEMIPEIEQQGIQFTFVSELITHNY